jgi:hypothetical protein
MATVEQLRAALAALDADPSSGEHAVQQNAAADNDVVDADGVEHARLTGLLYRIVATELRCAVSEAPDAKSWSRCLVAVSPQSVAVDDEDLLAQADFDLTG